MIIQLIRTSFIFSIFLLMSSCSKTLIPYQRTGEVNAVSHENSIIILSSQGRAESKNRAVYYAERNAFENLFFKGIPNTNQESPMVSDETSAGGVKALQLAEDGYERFIMDSYTANVNGGAGGYLVEQVVKIDLRGLRNHLENEGISKKFGL